VTKLSYLISFLKGDASVYGLPLVDRSYEVAKVLLKERYGNQDTLIKALFANIRSAPTFKENSKEILTFIDNMRINIRSLESLGITVYFFKILLLKNCQPPINISVNDLSMILRVKFQSII